MELYIIQFWNEKKIHKNELKNKKKKLKVNNKKKHDDLLFRFFFFFSCTKLF